MKKCRRPVAPVRHVAIGQTPMKATELLKKQHREVKG
jgi:hypothetical protein